MDVSAVILVPAIAATAIVGFLLALFASNAYLQVMQGTAAGAKQIEWPSETIPDHFAKVGYVLWMFGLVAGPSFAAGRVLSAPFESPTLNYAFPVILFWLCFPLCQLSSLGGPTPWLPLWPELFLRLKQKPRDLLACYLVSGLVLIAFAAAVSMLIGRGPDMLLFVGAPLAVVCWLCYARILGRLAFVLRFTRGPRRSRRKPERRERSILIPPPQETEASERADRRRVKQPSQEAPIQTPDEGPLHGYDVRFADDPPFEDEPLFEVIEEESPPPEPLPEPEIEDAFAREATNRRRQKLDRSRRWEEEDDDSSAYVAHEAEVKPGEVAPKELLTPKASDVRLLERDGPKKPRRAWTPDLFLFILDSKTASVAIWLSLLCVLLGGFLRLARMFAPVGE